MKTIANRNPDTQTTVTLVTPCAGICPHSHEPQPGSTIIIRYTPGNLLLELHAVEEWMASITEAIDLETMAQEAATHAAAALGIAVHVEARYKLRNGLEIIVCCRN